MYIVNPAIHLRAIDTLFYIFSYEHFEEVTGLDRWGDLYSDTGQCAFVVERDICGWVRTWSPAALDRLKTTLEFYLEHDPASLIGRAQQEYEFWTEHPIAAVWKPLYHGVFDQDPVVRDRSEYELLDTETMQQADLDALGFTYDPYDWFSAAVSGGLIGNDVSFEPAPPDWPWLEPIALEAYERRLHRSLDVFLQPFPTGMKAPFAWKRIVGLSREKYQALDDGLLQRESRFRRFGHRLSHQGLCALSQALLHAKRGRTDWFHEGPALLRPPMAEFSNFQGALHVYCRPERMDEVSGRKHLKISDIADLHEAMRLAAVGLGLDLAPGMKATVEQARHMQQERPSLLEPYSTWATLAELTLRAQDENLLLYT